jgi:glycosyltransferase involved in cell wall biosynthesis
VLALRRVLRDRRIEIAHAHETAPLLALRLAATGLGIPVVFTFHGATPDREAAVARLARRAADLTISPSQASLDALIARGLPREGTRRLGLGVAPLAGTAAAEVADLRGRLLGPDGRFLVLSLSRLSAQKGIDVMIDVAARVGAVRPDIVFAVAGGGAPPAEAEGQARAAGVAPQMRFLGPVRNVAEHLRAADLFLLTSRWENLPISIVEAFRAGLPVVATDCGGVRELVDASVGALRPVGDAAGIAGAVLDLAGDPDLRARKGAAALVRSAEPRFDPETVHASFEAMYRDLLRSFP